MDAITFVMTAEVRTALLPTRQVEAVFWLIAIPRRSNQVRAACVMEPSWRHLRQRCKRSLAALGGRSWILAAGCGGGRSRAVMRMTHTEARYVCSGTWYIGSYVTSIAVVRY